MRDVTLGEKMTSSFSCNVYGRRSKFRGGGESVVGQPSLEGEATYRDGKPKLERSV